MTAFCWSAGPSLTTALASRDLKADNDWTSYEVTKLQRRNNAYPRWHHSFNGFDFGVILQCFCCSSKWYCIQDIALRRTNVFCWVISSTQDNYIPSTKHFRIFQIIDWRCWCPYLRAIRTNTTPEYQFWQVVNHGIILGRTDSFLWYCRGVLLPQAPPIPKWREEVHRAYGVNIILRHHGETKQWGW